MFAESEPASGSVIAIAAQRPLKRRRCSSFATAAIAALPRPWRGIVSARPTSPQHSSVSPSTVDMFVPLRTPPPWALRSCLSFAAPAPPPRSPSFMPSITDASMSSSTGYSCSARSYLREMGRNTSVATNRACSTSAESLRGISSCMCSLPPLGATAVVIFALNQHAAFHRGERHQVAIPALHGVVFDETMPAEQLHAIGADFHALFDARD